MKKDNDEMSVKFFIFVIVVVLLASLYGNVNMFINKLNSMASRADAIFNKLESINIDYYKSNLDAFARKCDNLNCTESLLDLLINRTIICKEMK
jgi:hypothetical protein